MSFETELKVLLKKYDVTISNVIDGGEYNTVDLAYSDNELEYTVLRVVQSLDDEGEIEFITPTGFLGFNEV